MVTANLLQPYVVSIFQLLQTVYSDPNRTEALLRASMGVVGLVSCSPIWRVTILTNWGSDISEAFPSGEYSQFFRADWLTAMCRETRANKEFAPRTQETARWAREQIKRQAGKIPFPLVPHLNGGYHEPMGLIGHFERQSRMLSSTVAGW